MKLHKLFLILSFALLLVKEIIGQAAVDIQIMVHNNAGLSYPLWFGLDLAATDSIDPALGEADLPPPPPANAFDARWWIPPFNGSLSSWRDYRAPGDPPIFPFAGNIQHVIKFQSTDFPITISWSLPYIIHPTSYLRDPFGGALVNASFFGTDSVVINLAFIPYVEVSIDYAMAIPVELVSFNASILQKEKVVQLNWTTATETNNSGFEILRKAQNDNEYNTIGFVPGFGTTTEPRSYSFTDENVTAAIYKYRLKQIDFDGTFTYSNEIEVEVDFTPKEFVLYQNYPNPFNPNTSIQYAIGSRQYVTLIVYDILGNEVATLVKEEKQPGVYEVEFSVGQDSSPDIASGIYFNKLNAGSFTNTKKMILAK